MIRNKCGKLKLRNLVLASHIFPVIKFLLADSIQLLKSNIQKHEKKKKKREDKDDRRSRKRRRKTRQF